MTLGTFQPRARITGDKLNLVQYSGRPLLVRAMEFVPDFSSREYPDPKPVVFCDAVDLISGQIFINCLWGAGAVVDNLKERVGTEEVVPVKAAQVTGKNNRAYTALYPLEGAELDAAVNWYNTSWGYVDQTRQQRMAQAAAAVPAPGAPMGAPAPGPAAPVATPPIQAPAPQYAPVPPGPAQGYGQVPAPAPQYAPQQAPATQFGAPATQPPANPAYAPQAAPQFGAPQAQPAAQYAPQPPQGFGAPAGGVFSDVPPGPPAGAPATQFAPPQAQDPAAAQAALTHLNQQV